MRDAGREPDIDVLTSDKPVPLQEVLRALEGLGPEESVASLREACGRRPDDPVVLTALGIALGEVGRWDDAIEALDTAHYLRPSNPQILYNYGLALESAGRYPEARRRYEAALRLKPESERVRRRLEALPSAPAPTSAKKADAPSPPSQLPERRRTPVPATTPDEPTEDPEEERRRILDELLAPAPPPTLMDHLEGVVVRPPVDADWEPERLPGPITLARTTLMLWFQQPLLWIALFLPANALAALFAPPGPRKTLPAALCWLGAFALGGGGVLTAMAGECALQDRRGEAWGDLPKRVIRATLLFLTLTLATVTPLCVLMVKQAPVSGWGILLSMLLLAAPLHLVLAPAVVMAGSHGPGGWRAVGAALRLVSRRFWARMLTPVLFGAGLTLLLLFMARATQEAARGHGFAVVRSLEVGALCMVESLWAAMLTIAGLDALAEDRIRREGEGG